MKLHRYIICIASAAAMSGCAEPEETHCRRDADCPANQVCTEAKICEPKPCFNGVKDIGETDTDCGGICAVKCSEGKACIDEGDCETGTCLGGKCAVSACPAPKDGQLVITEIFNNISKDKFFDENSSKQTEFFEVWNSSDTSVLISDVSIECQRTDTNSKPITIHLEGKCLSPRDVLVISHTPIENMPQGVHNLVLLPEAGMLANTGSYTCSLMVPRSFGSDGSRQVPLHTAMISSSKANISQVPPETAYSPDPVVFSDHTAVSTLQHSPGLCTNGMLFRDKCESHCENSAKDADETDTDCGGRRCRPCEADKACLTGTDCLSGQCQANICVFESCKVRACPEGEFCGEDGHCFSCTDGVRGGDETDIDCGGTSCEPCASGRHCERDTDCASFACQNNRCVGEAMACQNPEPGDIIISEIFNKSTASAAMKTYFRSNQNEAEFIEIVNLSSKLLCLDGTVLTGKRTDSDAKDIVIALSRTLAPKQAAVISGTPIQGLPSGTASIIGLAEKNALTNTAVYNWTLSFGTSRLHAVYETDASRTSISRTLAEPVYSAEDTALIDHTAVNAILKYSPGFCSNGGVFADNCALLCQNGVKDENETDIDCGGNICARCTDGKTCAVGEDCQSGQCASGICTGSDCRKTGCELGLFCDTASGRCHACTDNEINGDETDIDCGGAACAPCQTGQKCISDSDCRPEDMCSEEKVCAKNPCKPPEIGDLVITEILNSANASGTMQCSDGTEQPQAEFIEIVNISGQKLNLAPLRIHAARQDRTEDKNWPLSGCLEASQAAVLSGTSIPLPEGAVLLNMTPASNALVNSGTYRYTIETQDGTILHTADDTPQTQGISRSIADLTYQPTFSLVDHSTLSSFLNMSPGYCANGGLYSSGCISPCEDGRQNGDESDIDCGGNICAPCKTGQKCISNSDCRPEDMCYDDGICTPNPCKLPEIGDLVIAEVLNYANASGTMQCSDGTEQPQAEFIEIVNISGKKLNLANTVLHAARQDASGDKTWPLSGCLDPKQPAVLCGSAIPVPSGALLINMTPASNALVNSGTYRYTLETQDGTVLHTANDTVQKSGQSHSIGSLTYSPAFTLVDHSTLGSALKMSPGYCANGSLYVNNCL